MRIPARCAAWTIVLVSHGLGLWSLTRTDRPDTDPPPDMSVSLVSLSELASETTAPAPRSPAASPSSAASTQSPGPTPPSDMTAPATPPTVTRSAAFVGHAPVSPSPATVSKPADAAPAPAFESGVGSGRATASQGAPPTTSASTPATSARAQGDYAARVRAWLEAHKTYPRKARQRREEGVAEIFLVLDRKGRVLRGELVRGSGHALLDAEVLAMLDRAAPFPPAPREVFGERLELSAVIDFHLER